MIIETANLTKLYGEKIGCKDISIEVTSGEIFGFLGPNGAGKSTFVKTLLGLIFPTSGNANILGKPIGNYLVRKKIGYLPESFKYQDWMTGLDLLSFHYFLCKLDKKNINTTIEKVLELVNLKGHEKYKVGTYSKGMQQRIGIAAALLSDPDLIIFDEPSSALDPIGRMEVRDIMLKMKSIGKTVFLNSHLLNEVEMICDSIAVINKGFIVSSGKTSQLLNVKYYIEIKGEYNNEILRILKTMDNNMEIDNNIIKINVTDENAINDIAHVIINNNGKLFSLKPCKSSLEDIFVNLIKEDGGNSV